MQNILHSSCLSIVANRSALKLQDFSIFCEYCESNFLLWNLKITCSCDPSSFSFSYSLLRCPQAAVQVAGRAKIKPTQPRLEQAQRTQNSRPLREQIKVSFVSFVRFVSNFSAFSLFSYFSLCTSPTRTCSSEDGVCTAFWRGAMERRGGIR